MRDSGKVWRFCDSGRSGPADLHTDPFLAFPGRKTPASGKEKGEADIEQRERADRDAGAADDLKRHAPDKEIPIRKKTPTEIPTKEMQPVIERPEHPHQRRRLLHPQLQMLRRVKNQRRIKNRKPQRREDLDKE